MSIMDRPKRHRNTPVRPATEAPATGTAAVGPVAAVLRIELSVKGTWRAHQVPLAGVRDNPLAPGV